MAKYPDPTAEEITAHMLACGHAVDQINAIKMGIDFHTNGRFTQAEINTVVQRSVDHLELQAKKDWYKDDSVSRTGNNAKAKHATAITDGKKYITDNGG